MATLLPWLLGYHSYRVTIVTRLPRWHHGNIVIKVTIVLKVPLVDFRSFTTICSSAGVKQCAKGLSEDKPWDVDRHYPSQVTPASLLHYVTSIISD